MHHTYSRNKTRDSIQAGNVSDIRIHGLKGNMNEDQPWASVRDACIGELCGNRGSQPVPPGYSLPFGPPGWNPSGLAAFSATCYYFAESLAEQMGHGVPLGMIHTAWGGSKIEEWTTDKVTASCSGMMAPTPGFTQAYWDTRVRPYLDMTLKGWAWCECVCSA